MLAWDRELFLLLNFDGGSLLDSVSWFLSGKLVWIPLYLLILYLIYNRYGWRAMLLSLVFMGLGVVLADKVAWIFKHYTPKLRPTHTPSLEGLVHIVRGYTGGPYGTVSAHAATTFCIATFSSALIRNRWFTMPITIWAVLVSYSRIYLGVHFPIDILLGATLGLLTGLLMLKLYRLTINRFLDDFLR